MSILKFVFLYLALLFLFSNGALYLFVFKRYKVNLMNSPIPTPPIFISCLLGAGILLSLVSHFAGNKILHDIGFLIMVLFFFCYEAFGVWTTIGEISELRKKGIGVNPENKQ